VASLWNDQATFQVDEQVKVGAEYIHDHLVAVVAYWCISDRIAVRVRRTGARSCVGYRTGRYNACYNGMDSSIGPGFPYIQGIIQVGISGCIGDAAGIGVRIGDDHTVD